MEILEVKVERTMPIRMSVFCDEQGFNDTIEESDLLETTIHLIVNINGVDVCTARVLNMDDYYKISRVATLKEYRGKSYGKEIIEYIINNFADKYLYLESQEHAVCFYRSCKFKVEGDRFLSQGTPHFKMTYKNRD